MLEVEFTKHGSVVTQGQPVITATNYYVLES